MNNLIVSITSGTKAMLEDSQFQTLDAIMKKFEMVESRFASIRKYVKTMQIPTTTGTGTLNQQHHQQKALQIESSGFSYSTGIYHPDMHHPKVENVTFWRATRCGLAKNCSKTQKKTQSNIVKIW